MIGTKEVPPGKLHNVFSSTEGAQDCGRASRAGGLRASCNQCHQRNT